VSFEEDSRRFEETQAVLREAIKATRGSVVVGRVLIGVFALLPWWLSGATWWAIPVFMVVIGWVGGEIFGRSVAHRLKKKIKADYPELKL